MNLVLMKTEELIGPALDWAVAVAEGMADNSKPFIKANTNYTFRPSTDWAQGGLIIEREEIGIKRRAPNMPGEQWEAMGSITARGAGYRWGLGPTPLIAAMRCYVASKMGDEVGVPAQTVRGTA